MCDCCSAHNKKSIEEIVAQFKGVKGGLIPALHAIDAEYRAIPEEALVVISKELNIPVAEVFGVASFYAKFEVGERGANVIRICESAPCHIAGAADVVTALENALGIKAGETTADGKFTLELTECVGMCNGAPVVTINERPFVDITAAKIPEILAQF